MADSEHLASNPPAQTAIPQHEQAERPVPLRDHIASDGGGNCPLWDGHIIDATFPLV